MTRLLRLHPAESSRVRVRAFPLRFSASAPGSDLHRRPPPPNNSFKPTPCRGIGRVLYATLAHVRRPATGRLNSGVRARMAKNRDLKGIACGVAETFISRNNDVFGYWGIGMLYKEAIEHSVTVIELDLMTGQSLPEAPVSQAVVSHYSAYITNRLAGLQILAAKITLEFGTFGKAKQPWALSYGDPFVCTVLLVSTTGRTHVCSRAGRSRPHSSIESRRHQGGP